MTKHLAPIVLILAIAFSQTLFAQDVAEALIAARMQDSCQEPLPIDKAEKIMEEGICPSSATLLGKPVCEYLKKFSEGSAPAIPIGAVSVGVTFRVEVAKNGARVWSEENPMYVIYNMSQGKNTDSVRVLDVSPGSEEEATEATQYLRDSFAGKPTTQGSLANFISEMRDSAQKISLQASKNELIGDMRCGKIYIRQNANLMYAFISSMHGNSWEIDSHPVLYFVIFPAPSVPNNSLKADGGDGRAN